MAAHDPDFLDPIGPAGVPFPSEGEWLDLPAPPANELTIAPDFVDRTLQAVAAAPTAEQELDRPLLDAVRRRAFAAPEPSPTFVDDTLAALRRDKTARWRELLTRHIAPEPSPEFVARTLDALRADVQPVATKWAWPLVGIAAGAAMWLAFGHRTETLGTAEPLELRLARASSPAFSHSYAVTPLPAVLSLVAHDDDPYALPDAVIDGPWIVLGGRR